MILKFCGAAGIVTGSCYLVDMGDEQILVDCGLFQGPKEVTALNYQPFDFNPTDISKVVLTHAHLDHIGLIPKLVKEGFDGDIIGTPATMDLAKIILEDSAGLQVSETEQENRRRVREGLKPRQPLYDKNDARVSFRLFKKVPYNKMYPVSDQITINYRDAGHILGSAITEMFVEDEETKKIVFSGDLGQPGSPIVADPTFIETADYLIIESTYGDKLHEGIDEREQLLLKYARETYKKGGKLMIPSFALERTQELLYTIGKLVKSGEFPNEKIFLDSPLATKATRIFEEHFECYDKEMRACKNPFNFKGLVYTPEAQDSMMLNDYNKPCVIIAGSGMCTGGRIRHHFKHGLWNPRNTVLFVGYQAEGTLGRVIIDGAKQVKMMGMIVAVGADIKSIHGFSAHADYKGLLRWARGFKRKPKNTFIVHGEPGARLALKSKLESEGFKCYLPAMGEGVEI